MTLGKTIQTARKAKNLSAANLAEHITGRNGSLVSQSYISQIENGGVIPNKDILTQISNFLGMDLEVLSKMAVEEKLEVCERELRRDYGLL